MTITASTALNRKHIFIALTEVRDIFVPENERACKFVYGAGISKDGLTFYKGRK
ncbi:MAG: hypothetical protein RBT69_12260 [Spirochaetia bacterium]|jgi:hypothetical protein|nr:hypothetical protein [Spirochaetia bacterium]